MIPRKTFAKRIAELTPAQAALIATYLAEWEVIGLSTEPAQCIPAERGVHLMYAAAGLAPPARVVWTASPQASAEAYRRTFTHEKYAALQDPGGSRIRERIETLWKKVDDAISNRIIYSPDGVKYRLYEQLTVPLEERVWQRVARAVFNDMTVANRGLWDWHFSSHDSPNDFGGRVRSLVHGQHDAQSFVTNAFFREVCGLVEETEPYAGHLLLARSANWWIACRDVCFISDRPYRLCRDPQGHLHCADGPALEYRDGFGMCYWHGRRVSKQSIKRLATIGVKEIDAETDTTMRRMMLEYYGAARYLQECDAPIIHSDEYGDLYRRDFLGDTPLVMVRVRNSTPKPDGNHQHYWLRVPPTIHTAHEAVAWTFGLTPDEYRPDFEI